MFNKLHLFFLLMVYLHCHIRVPYADLFLFRLFYPSLGTNQLFYKYFHMDNYSSK